MQKDQYITNGIARRKVLARVEDLVALSYAENKAADWKDCQEYWETITALTRGGWHVEEDKEEDWTPKYEEYYWYINDLGIISMGCWNNLHCHLNRKNFLGIFKTKEAAQKRLDEIKEKLNK